MTPMAFVSSAYHSIVNQCHGRECARPYRQPTPVKDTLNRCGWLQLLVDAVESYARGQLVGTHTLETRMVLGCSGRRSTAHI